ncbi:lipopolysaccharide biosynthesis protein [Kiritimatiella glycovorans]|uniref:Putative membrane protein EpsK n=1 Tax=Kiritimatiella glycovorans TaxID=1307763 RepID=A0A0G3EAJ6_9BACT|nr:oligosaccharide flippase family protein [Kiritimatiella glycovorans]AKJ63476.1 putative membrane protein EpsK [Kiritimatiella glycovorans]
MKPRHIFTNVSWAWLRLIVNALAALILTPLLIDRLGDTAYGVWVLIGSILGYYGLLNLGIDSSAVRYLSRALGSGDRDRAAVLLRTSAVTFRWIAAAVLLLTALLGWGFAQVRDGGPFQVPVELSDDFVLLLWLLGAGVAVSFALRVYSCALRALERYDLEHLITIGATIGRVLAIIFLMHGSIVRLGLIFAAFNVLSGAAQAVAAHRLLKPLNLPARPRGRMYGTVGRYGVWALLTSLADRFRYHTDPLVIGYALAPAAITVYSVAHTLIRYFSDIAGQFGMPFFPVFSRYEGAGDEEGLRRAFLRGSRVQGFLALLLAGGLGGSGPLFLRFWVGGEIGPEALAAASAVLSILVLPVLLDVMQTISVCYLYGVGKHPYLSMQTTAEGLANLALSLVLAGPFGLVGVAWGTAVPMTVTKLLVQPAYVCRQLRIPWGRYVLGNLMGPVLLAAVLAVSQRVFFRLVPPSTFAGFLLGAALTALVFAAVAALVFLRREDRRWIADWLRGRGGEP